MSEFYDIMLLPLLACVILTGIHAYLGLHVLAREVVFVDIALAQVAALGATCGFLFGLGLHSLGSYLCSLAFTLVGAALLAATRFRKPVVPHEAIIGVVYSVSAAGAILVLSRAAEGGEELKSLMVGHLLFVDQAEVLKIFAIYSTIGLVHFLFRKPFFQISLSPELAFQEGRRVRLWDFLFYATFGVVVTSSVELAGVLLVFAFLIVPSICGILLAERPRSRLLIGWAAGVFTSLLGIVVSYTFDLPTGAAVVVCFGFTALICGVLRIALRSGQPGLQAGC